MRVCHPPRGLSMEDKAYVAHMQMPKGVPVATVAIGNAANAGLLAVRMLAASDAQLQVGLFHPELMSETCSQFGSQHAYDHDGA